MMSRWPQRIVRTPTMLQMEAVECGAAALGIVLAHFGRWVPLEELRIACGVTRDGAKASNVLKAARRYGLSGKGFRKEPEGLTELPMPSILHWNFNHFLVLEGIRNGRAYLNDPATGRRAVSLEELHEAFTGVVLAFEPGEAFAPGGRKPAPWKVLAGDQRTARGNVALIAVFSLMLVVPGLLVPGLGKLFIDRVLIQQFESWVGPLCIGLAVTGLLQALVTALQQGTLLRLEARLSASLSARVLHRLLALPMAFFVQRSSGELAGRVASADAVARMLTGEVATSLFNLTAVVVYGLALALFHPVLLAIALCVPALSLMVLAALRRRMVDVQTQVALDQAKLQSATSGLILGMETLKVSGSESQGFSRWAGHQARCLAGMQRLGGWLGLLTVTPQFASALGTAAVLVAGAWLVVHGELTIGGIVAVQALMAAFVGPFNSLVTISDRLMAARGDLVRLADTLNYRDHGGEGLPAAVAAPPPALPRRLEGHLDIEGLTFGYSRLDPPLIRDFSLTLRPGMRVALVGGSGSGKSTLGRLVAGLLPPWEGVVRLDGHPMDALPRQVFANTLAYVDQDVFLFEGSVRDNLTLWNPSIPDAVLTQALKDAGMHANIAARPGHFDAQVAEGGANFSGGERQRLEIARALAGDPSVLVLDEATAALDPVTEKALDDNLRRRGLTCIIIAHRLSTIRDCDEIIVLERGRIAERGTHDALIESGGRYADLIGGGR